MALMSMTGYGEGIAVGEGLRVEVELCSVNRRQFEIRVSLPRHLSVIEARLTEFIQKHLSRGSVSCTVRLSTGRGGAGPVVDMVLARQYAAKLRAAGRQLGLRDDLGMAMLLTWPGVVSAGSDAVKTAAIWRLIREALVQAMQGMLRMRAREGAHLRRDLVARLRTLRKRLAIIRRLAPGVRERYSVELHKRLERLGIPAEPSDDRVLKEIALFAERCDIAEELVRLASHLRQADQMLTGNEPAGRPLDFLCQEMFREINTIGSKANDARLSALVVDFKTELERLREQVQNVE